MLSKRRAAEKIQNKWRTFVHNSKTEPLKARVVAALLGKQLSKFSEVEKSLLENKIIVQANGALGNPLEGHSCFYVNRSRIHMMFMHPIDIPELDIKPDYISKRPVSHYPIPEYLGAHVVILTDEGGFTSTEDFVGSFTYLCDKGSIFVLNDNSATLFETAYRQEIENIKGRRYSYGLHYNCNTFVTNVLCRILQFHLEI
ncbi:hypothetical protein [Enterobacter sp. Bisph1]|uniref:hypothetical protein n=1 Tax=Enterobacter sp. Bisph1 TaxID=1274399 RepID=UPI00057BEF9D|nr:hypothetical protein [Enterobacter sp. Bisph1]